MLDYREARGYKRTTYMRDLIKFDIFCTEHYPNSSELTSEIVYSWLDAETSSAHCLAALSSAVRQFGKYLNAVGETAYVLPEKFATHKASYLPYNFTDYELTALFASIDNMPPDKGEPFLTEIVPVLFRLIYTCGLRPNEGRELLAENINLNNGEILITRTKMNKERIVVMSDDMLAAARKYDLRRKIFGGDSLYFFPASDGGAFKNVKILAAFNKAWTTATCTPQNPLPHPIRVYDLRHRFASACLNRWLDNGENLMVMLPYLSVYMGHKSLSETAYYIHILPENLVKSAAVDWTKFNEMFSEVSL